MNPRSRPPHGAADTGTAVPPFLQRARRLAAISSAQMPGWQLRAVYAASTALILSGTVWLLLHYFAPIPGDFGPTPNPYEHRLLAVHGAAAMAFLIVLGSLLPVHLLRGLALRRNLVTGFALIGFNVLLIVTGYGLYYAGGDALRHWISLAHWLPGLGVGGLLVLHITRGRRGRV